MNKQMDKEKKSVLDQLLDERSPAETRKNKDKMFLAVRIADLIKERGYAKSAFAALMKQQPSVISKWLSGTHNFTAETLSEIAFNLEMTLTELVKEKPSALISRAAFGVASAAVYPAVRYYGGGPCLDAGKAPDICEPAMIQGSISMGTLIVLDEDAVWKRIDTHSYDIKGLSVSVIARKNADNMETHPQTDHNHELKA